MAQSYIYTYQYLQRRYPRDFLKFYFSLYFLYPDLSRLFRLFKRVQGENNDVLMDWLKMVHDYVRRYFPEEVKEMENYKDLTTYFEVRGVFFCQFF